MIAVGVIALVLGGCARWVLPSQVEAKGGEQFETYEQVQGAYARIAPFTTTAGDLTDMGIHPGKTPNLQIINYLEIRSRFMQPQTVQLKDLDPAVQACINAREACEGWFVPLQRISRERVGDVSLDMLGFRRETVSTGWRAEMVLLLVDDVVVYKLWSGTPNVNEATKEVKPLGPFQDLSGAAAGAVKGAIQ